MQPVHQTYDPSFSDSNTKASRAYDPIQMQVDNLKTYACFLNSVEDDLFSADEDAMRELQNKICWIKPLFTNTPLQDQADNSPFPYDSFNTFDLYLISAIETAAKQQTSPQSSKMRQALAPLVSVRRNLLAEFDAADSHMQT